MAVTDYTPPRADQLRADAIAAYRSEVQAAADRAERQAASWQTYSRGQAVKVIRNVLGLDVGTAPFDWHWSGDLNTAVLTGPVGDVTLEVRIHARTLENFGGPPDGVWVVLDCPDPGPGWPNTPHTHRWEVIHLSALGALLASSPSHADWFVEHGHDDAQDEAAPPEYPSAAQAVVDAIRLVIHEEIDAP